MVNLPNSIIELADDDEYYNLLVYGDSGVGKTVLAGSDDDVLFIAPEDQGTMSAKRFGSSAKKWKVITWDDVVNSYDWLYKNFVAEEEPIPFNWLALDSITELQSMCMRKVLDEAVANNPSRDPDVPQIQDYMPYYLRFERMVKAFCSLPVHVLFTALQQDEENEDDEKVVLPMLQGKGTQYSKKMAGLMTAFGHMTVIRRKTDQTDEETGKPIFEDRRMIQWKSSRTVMAKDRTRCLEPRTVNKSLKDIRELLESGPAQPAPGRTPPSKRKAAPNRLVDGGDTLQDEEKNSELVDTGNPKKGREFNLVSVGTEDDE